VNLAAVTGSATFVDAISFAATTAGNVVTVTNGALNTFVIGGASTTADVLTVNAAYAGGTVMAATAFEIVNFTTVAQAQTVTAPVGAITVNSSVAQVGLSLAAGTTTTGVNTSNATGAAVVVDNATAASLTTFTHTGAGALTITMTADTSAADTVTATGTGVITVNQIAVSGVTTVNLNATGTSADVINVSGAGVGIILAADRVVVNNFNPNAQDRITLDIDQTTVGTAAAGTAVSQIVSAAGAVVNGAVDVLILNFDMGGATAVLAGDLTGASLLANLGGNLTTANATDENYIVAFDNGNMYLYNATAAATTYTGGMITLIGVFSGVTVGQISESDFILA